VDSFSGIGCEGVDLDLERIVDAEAAADEILLDPVAELVLGLALRGGDVLKQEMSEILGGGVGFGEDRGVPVVDRELSWGLY
jgi:hypothetical protein